MHQTFESPQGTDGQKTILKGLPTMIITQSGRAVKPKTFKRPAKMGPGTAQIVRAQRRAKAPAPWANEAWGLTESGAAIMQEPVTTTAITMAAVKAATKAASMKLPQDMTPAEAVAEVLRCYRVEESGDHLRFSGNVTGDFVRVSIPAAGEEPLALRGTRVSLPATAFENAAELWLAWRKGEQAQAQGRATGMGADHAR